MPTKLSAAEAGARGVSAQPMRTDMRVDIYLAQTGSFHTFTPRQARRLAKKMRRNEKAEAQ